jgi:hypothetical protein
LTVKIVFATAPLVARGYGAGKTLAWYLSWRLQRA